jgi:predicted nucleic acid-binding protein
MIEQCIKHLPANQVSTEVIDNPTPRINLATSEDIRREMAKVYRDTRCNKILPSNGTKLVYMLINILKAYEVSEMEQRLTDLELANLEGNK